jgi:FMN phosphatase YigB (HAD superfamily)
VQRECLLFDFFGTLVEYQQDRSRISLPETTAYLQSISPAIERDGGHRVFEQAFKAVESLALVEGREFLMDEVGVEVFSLLSLEPGPGQVGQLLAIYMREWCAGIVPVTGAAGLLRRLSANYRLGLISNTHDADMVRRLLHSFEMHDYFASIVLSADVGIPKPDRRIFIEAMQALETEPQQCTYIGDSYEHDYVGAARVGMACYLIGAHARVPRQCQLRSILDLPIYFQTGKG